MSEEMLYFNGINGATGEYLLPPMSPPELVAAIKGELPPDKSFANELRNRAQTAKGLGESLGTAARIDSKNLAETGWGVIFPATTDTLAATAIKAVYKELKPLLDLRREQAGRLYREFASADGYRPGESKREFLERFGIGSGPVDPNRGVPYYLLLIGSPEEIPYRFQYQLDVQFAVGRLHFPTPQEYGNYARSVVAAETGQTKLQRRVEFFGVQNEDDRATQLSATELVQPLATKLAETEKNWTVRQWIKDDATKSRLVKLLGGDETPALLFTASHGMGFPNGDALQLGNQGALLCQEWTGPRKWGRKPIPPEFYFSGASRQDVPDSASLTGLIAFHFACYGAGTPALNDFAHHTFTTPTPIAPHAFVAPLPQRLLGHPQGGALAVIGHVERAWGYSFMSGRAGRQLTVFESALNSLLNGCPVGAAVEYLNERYAELATELSSDLENIKFGTKVDDFELAGLWTAHNDARGYAIVGDPAVRLAASVEVERDEKSPLYIVATPPSSLATAAANAEPHSAPLADVEDAVVEQPTKNTSVTAPLTTAPENKQTTNYDLLDPLRDTGRPRAAEELRQLREKMTVLLARTINDLGSVEIVTYSSPDISQVASEAGEYTSAQICARTRLALDGDVWQCVPEQAKIMDERLWKIHAEAVAQARAHQVEIIKALAETLTALAKGLML